MIPLLYGVLAGGIGGMVMAVLIHLAPLFSYHGEKLPDIDSHYLLNRRFSHREMHLFGIFMQLGFSAIFGGVYVMLVNYNILFHDFHYLSILFYGVLVWLVKGLIVTPILGIGFFGVKEGKYVWFEMFLLHQIYGFIFWLAMKIYV